MNKIHAQYILEINVTDIFEEYDIPEEIPEWSWIESNAMFKHVHNAESGIWEFIVNLNVIQDDLSSVPGILMPVVSSALNSGYNYILFNQGT